jgi:hypothetical protein
MHHLYYEQPCLDLQELGTDISGLAKDMLEEGTRAIDELSLDCAHVKFDRLLTDPVGMVRDVYEHFGWTFSKEYEEILERFLEEDKKKREEVRRKKGGESGMHEHSLEHFGLREEDFSNDKFQTYLGRFGLEDMKK